MEFFAHYGPIYWYNLCPYIGLSIFRSDRLVGSSNVVRNGGKRRRRRREASLMCLLIAGGERQKRGREKEKIR